MSPVECDVYEFDCEASTMRRSWPTTGCLAKGRKKSQCFCESTCQCATESIVLERDMKGTGYDGVHWVI